jgi:mRNA interferase MazF
MGGAPVYTRRDSLPTQVDIGIGEGLKHESSIHCDELMSLSKSFLTSFIGSLSPAKQALLDRALAFALGRTSDTFPEGA